MAKRIVEWRDVPGFEGLYEVSNDGRIKSLQGRNFGNEKSQFLNNGYQYVYLSCGSMKKSIAVHRIVAIAFIPNPEGKPAVNHINGDKTDNRVENLEWVTAKENTTHAVKAGLFNPDIYKAKKLFAFNKETGEVLAFKSVTEASKELNLNSSEISRQANMNNKYRTGTSAAYYFVYVKEGENNGKETDQH